MERFSYAKLYHSGILGQRWGHRRFQYEDGSLTPAGRLRYGRYSNRGERFRDKLRDAATPNVVKNNDVDYRKIASKKQLSKMTDEEIVRAGERLDLEKTLVDKSVALNKSIGEKATPRYLDKLKEINLASKEVRDIVSNVADARQNLLRTVEPMLNYPSLIPKPDTTVTETKYTTKMDAEGKINRQWDVNSTQNTTDRDPVFWRRRNN